MKIEIDPVRPNQRMLLKVAAMLNNEAVIILPTDTSYAFACSLESKKAMERVYLLSGVNPKKPKTFLCKRIETLQNYTHAISNPVYRILKQMIPGKNTFIFNASKLTPKRLLSERKQIGIRIPDATVVQILLNEIQSMLLISKVPQADQGDSIHHPLDIFKKYQKSIDGLIDIGEMPITESSVIDLTEEIPIILRRGNSDISAFESLLHSS